LFICTERSLVTERRFFARRSSAVYGMELMALKKVQNSVPLARLGMEYVVRFLTGGLFVSGFALLGDILRPKSFAGLFSAAPSVALASLSLALLKDGEDYVAIEARSMVIGSIASLFTA
jgi:hypothetical protein